MTNIRLHFLEFQPEITSFLILWSDLDTSNLDTSNLDTSNLDTSNLDTSNLDISNLDTSNLVTSNLVTSNHSSVLLQKEATLKMKLRQ